MEKLPFEVVAKIFDLLRLKQKIKLRSVSPEWKVIAENHLLDVKCIKCHPDLFCRFGCKALKDEICPDASDPDIFLKIMELCPNVEQLALIPSSVNAFRAPPGSGDCGEAAWKKIISMNLGDTRCLTWDGLELNRPIHARQLKHLSCGKIPAKALKPVIQNLEGLFYAHTDFQDWSQLPHGMKFLRTGCEGDFVQILSSKAMETIVDLELASPIPECLPFEPSLPNMEKLTYYSVRKASNEKQLEVLKSILDSSPKLNKLILEILFDDDEYFLEYLPKFFQSLKRLELTLYMVTLRKEHSIAESMLQMVLNSPKLIEACIRIPDLSDEELLTMTCWENMKKLKLYSSKPAFRGTAFNIFIELMFKASLVELVVSNVVFTKSEQESLIRTKERMSLLVTYEDDWKKPVERPLDTAFDGEKKFIRMTFTKN